MKFLCIQQVTFEPPGNIALWANEREHSLDIIKIYNSSLPADNSQYDGLIMLGGPMSVNETDKYPWLKDEFALVEKFIKENKLILGICLGAQIIAKTLGSNVEKMPHNEIGFFPVCLTNQAMEQSKCFSKAPRCFIAFHWHGEMFSIPQNAIHIAKNQACPNQAFEYNNGKVLATQFHLETNRENLSALIANSAEDLRKGGKYVQRMEYMHDTLNRISNEYYNLLAQTLDNWTSQAKT